MSTEYDQYIKECNERVQKFCDHGNELIGWFRTGVMLAMIMGGAALVAVSILAFRMGK